MRNREIACELLSSRGLIVETACDGVEAFERFRQSKNGYYELILMDIQMPNMDGYKATKCIRNLQDKRKAELPIIAMTANAFQEDAEKCIAAGMNAHLAKPLDIEKVKMTIYKYI